MRGLRGCARKVIYSAWDGYGSYGCDIGGYRAQQLSPDDTKEYFLRSAQLNAFLPLMENGGAGEHRPWMVNGGDEEITAVYRELVNHHTRLALSAPDPGLLCPGGEHQRYQASGGKRQVTPRSSP